MYIKVMNLTTVTSEQIVSNEGELSIDIFKDMDYPDSSKFTINCNSSLNDGIHLYCPHGGIQFDFKNHLLFGDNTYIKNKNYKIETAEKISLESLH